MQVRVTFEIGVYEPDVGTENEEQLDERARDAADSLLPEIAPIFPGARLVEVGRERRYFKGIELPVPAEKPPF